MALSIAGVLGQGHRANGSGAFSRSSKKYTHGGSCFDAKCTSDKRKRRINASASGEQCRSLPEEEQHMKFSLVSLHLPLPNQVSRAFLSGVLFAAGALGANGKTSVPKSAALAVLAAATTLVAATTAGPAAATGDILVDSTATDASIAYLHKSLGPPNVSSTSKPAPDLSSIRAAEGATPPEEVLAHLEAAFSATEKLVQAPPGTEESRQAAREAASLLSMQHRNTALAETLASRAAAASAMIEAAQMEQAVVAAVDAASAAAAAAHDMSILAEAKVTEADAVVAAATAVALTGMEEQAVAAQRAAQVAAEAAGSVKQFAAEASAASDAAVRFLEEAKMAVQMVQNEAAQAADAVRRAEEADGGDLGAVLAAADAAQMSRARADTAVADVQSALKAATAAAERSAMAKVSTKAALLDVTTAALEARDAAVAVEAAAAAAGGGLPVAVVAMAATAMAAAVGITFVSRRGGDSETTVASASISESSAMRKTALPEPLPLQPPQLPNAKTTTTTTEMSATVTAVEAAATAVLVAAAVADVPEAAAAVAVVAAAAGVPEAAAEVAVVAAAADVPEVAMADISEAAAAVVPDAASSDIREAVAIDIQELAATVAVAAAATGVPEAAAADIPEAEAVEIAEAAAPATATASHGSDRYVKAAVTAADEPVDAEVAVQEASQLLESDVGVAPAEFLPGDAAAAATAVDISVADSAANVVAMTEERVTAPVQGNALASAVHRTVVEAADVPLLVAEPAAATEEGAVDHVMEPIPVNAETVDNTIARVTEKAVSAAEVVAVEAVAVEAMEASETVAATTAAAITGIAVEPALEEAAAVEKRPAGAAVEVVAATDPVAAEAVAATDSVAADAVAATDPVAAEAVAATDPVAAEAVAATDSVEAEAVAATDSVAAEAVAATDSVAAEAVAVTDPVEAEAVAATHPVVAEAVAVVKLTETLTADLREAEAVVGNDAVEVEVEVVEAVEAVAVGVADINAVATGAPAPALATPTVAEDAWVSKDPAVQQLQAQQRPPDQTVAEVLLLEASVNADTEGDMKSDVDSQEAILEVAKEYRAAPGPAAALAAIEAVEKALIEAAPAEAAEVDQPSNEVSTAVVVLCEDSDGMESEAAAVDEMAEEMAVGAEETADTAAVVAEEVVTEAMATSTTNEAELEADSSNVPVPSQTVGAPVVTQSDNLPSISINSILSDNESAVAADLPSPVQYELNLTSSERLAIIVSDAAAIAATRVSTAVAEAAARAAAKAASAVADAAVDAASRIAEVDDRVATAVAVATAPQDPAYAIATAAAQAAMSTAAGIAQTAAEAVSVAVAEAAREAAETEAAAVVEALASFTGAASSSTTSVLCVEVTEEAVEVSAPEDAEVVSGEEAEVGNPGNEEESLQVALESIEGPMVAPEAAAKDLPEDVVAAAAATLTNTTTNYINTGSTPTETSVTATTVETVAALAEQDTLFPAPAAEAVAEASAAPGVELSVLDEQHSCVVADAEPDDLQRPPTTHAAQRNATSDPTSDDDGNSGDDFLSLGPTTAIPAAAEGGSVPSANQDLTLSPNANANRSAITIATDAPAAASPDAAVPTADGEATMAPAIKFTGSQDEDTAGMTTETGTSTEAATVVEAATLVETAAKSPAREVEVDAAKVVQAAKAVKDIAPASAAADEAATVVEANVLMEAAATAPTATVEAATATESATAVDLQSLPIPLSEVLAALSTPLEALGSGVTDKLLDRIRVINKLLEEEQQRADLIAASDLLVTSSPAVSTSYKQAPHATLPPAADVMSYSTQDDAVHKGNQDNANETIRHSNLGTASGGAEAQSAVVPPPAIVVLKPPLLGNLKTELLDRVYGTARGVSANAEQRTAIDELVAALEAHNPNMSPTDAVSALGGRWKLVYTSHMATLMLLRALDSMPLVDVGDVVQTIDPGAMTATNKIDLAVPMPVSLRTEVDLEAAGLEACSPRQFKVRLTRVGLDTYLATPHLVAAIELQLPTALSVMGTSLDLGPVRALMEQINAGVEDLVSQATSPEFSLESVPLPPGVTCGSVASATSLWMLTTYLDDTLRVSRDDEGRVFVMLKDVDIRPE